MTTILGLRSGGVSYLAADSRTTSSDLAVPTKAKKIAQSERWAVGAAGLARANYLINQLDLGHETIHGLARDLRTLLIDDGWVKSTDCGSCAFSGFSALVISAGAFFHLGADLTPVDLEPDSPWGHGSGGAHAEAACKALLVAGWSPERALTEAIRVASVFDKHTDDRIEVVALGSLAAPETESPRQLGGIWCLTPDERSALPRIGPNGGAGQ